MKTLGANNQKAAWMAGLMVNGRRTRAGLIVAAVVSAVLPLLALVGQAHAEEYEAVTGAANRGATDPNPFIIGAYGFVWVALVIYVVGIARGLARAKAEITDLERRVATAVGGKR